MPKRDNDPTGEPAGSTERQSGPRTGVVLLVTLVLVAVLGGGGLLVARRLGSSDSDDAAPATTVAPLTTAEAAGVQSPTKVFERTTDAGITVRVFRSDQTQQFGPIGAGFDAPPVPDWCVASGTMQATAIGKSGVATAQSPTTKEAPDKGNVGFAVGGVIEQDPILAFVVQVGPDIDAVGASAVGGGTDSMQPVDGVAALALAAPKELADWMSGFGAAPGASDPWRGIFLELRKQDGSSTKLTGTAVQSGLPMWNDPTCTQQFNPPPGPTVTLPPPTLPPGTGEQPPDPEAAKRDIKAAMKAVYAAGKANDTKRLELIDDPSGVQFMIDRVRRTDNGIELDPSSLQVNQIGFLSAVEASFFYDLHLPDGQGFEGQYGRARFIDGAWKITRATICNDWEKVGTGCGP